MAHKIIDTNVPLTAAGLNAEASSLCKLECEEVVNHVLKSEITVLLDNADQAISEYRKNMYPDPGGTRAGQFLMYVLMNRHQPSRIRQIRLC